MAAHHSIDIIIPSFRLDETILKPIVHLPHPAGWQVAVYLVADNPQLHVTPGIRQWEREGRIRLIVNTKNEGPAETRNIGIRAGSGQWLLLLDDDIVPQNNLLEAYAAAIGRRPDAIGFVGITDFPAPVNAVTTAIDISGYLGHFRMPRYKPDMRWAPTANLMLNRSKLHPALFDASLKKSGEDIEFLVRNSLQYNEPYLSVPDAQVTHPWWGNGAVQTERLFRYGEGAVEMMRKPVIKPYTYRDFTNTSETLLLLLLLLPFALAYGWAWWVFAGAAAVVLAEFLVNWFKGYKTGGTASPAVAFFLMWGKNCHEAGALAGVFKTGYLPAFALRAELGFVKPHPGPFRLNRWKIIKMVLILVIMLAAWFFHV